MLPCMQMKKKDKGEKSGEHSRASRGSKSRERVAESPRRGKKDRVRFSRHNRRRGKISKELFSVLASCWLFKVGFSSSCTAHSSVERREVARDH